MRSFIRCDDLTRGKVLNQKKEIYLNLQEARKTVNISRENIFKIILSFIFSLVNFFFYFIKKKSQSLINVDTLPPIYNCNNNILRFVVKNENLYKILTEFI